MSKVKLTIYLLKKGTEKSDVFGDVAVESLGDDLICYKETYPMVPKDIKNFIGASNHSILDKLKTKSMAAAVLKEIEIDGIKRKFVVAFGYGWTLINETCIERDFGLKTVLNCAETSSIKQIEKKSISKKSKSSIEQMPTESTFFDFEFDENGDILTNVTASIKGWQSRY